jgi:hypothetical protein
MLYERQRKLIANLTIFLATTVFEALCNVGGLSSINQEAAFNQVRLPLLFGRI